MKHQAFFDLPTQSIVEQLANKNLKLLMLKAVTVVLWLLIIYNLWMPFAGLPGQILSWLGPILLVAHFVEYFVFSKKIKAKGDSAGVAFLMTMVFGVVYWSN